MADKHGAHQTDEAYVVSLCEDFCKSPSAPVGYMISQKLDMSTLVCGTVNGRGTSVLNMSSRITNVTGNEAGVGGGVVSGVNLGMCKPVAEFSPTVRAEGQCLLRHDTIMEMNTLGPEGIGNVKGKIAYSGTSAQGSGSCSPDAKKAIKHIKDALDKNGGDVGKATKTIETMRRSSQAASDNNALIYAHYWLKGRLAAPLGNFGRGLGVIYLWTKKNGLKFDKLSQIGVSKNEPSPYDPETEKWYVGGTLGKFPC